MKPLLSPATGWTRRLLAVARKELIHVIRDPMTLFFTLFVPIGEMFLLGFAINTNVRHIPTAVLDLSQTQESRRLLRQFENSQDFDLVAFAGSDTDLNHLIVSGKVHVGVKIPADYSRRLESGRTSQILVLVDGSESSIAAEALASGNAIAIRESLARVHGDRPLPIECRPRILFNPDTRSANFFIPGLIVVICQMMATMLSAVAIVREKERGTLEQLFMTPVRSVELIVGKMIPYLVLTFLEFCFVVGLMRLVFQVPIHGSFVTLLGQVFPFVLAMLGVGQVISSRADTREAATQLSMGTLLPSIFLSGYVFPVESMPLVFRLISKFLPTTWLIDASRGVILRGAGWAELWPNAVVLWLMAIVLIAIASQTFQKRLA